MINKIFKFVSFLMIMVLCIPNYLVSAEENNVEIIEPVFKDVNEIRYEDNILDKIPDEIVELTNLDMSSVSKLDVVDQENMASFTTVNNDGTKTLYSFNREIKYIDSATNTVKFIDADIEEINKKNDLGDIITYESEGSPVDVAFAKEAKNGVELNNGSYSIKVTPKIENVGEAEKKIDEEIVADADCMVSSEYIEYAGITEESSSLQYYVTNNGIKENIILEKYNGNNIIQFEIYTYGLVPSTSEGKKINFVDEETGNIEYTIHPTFIEEAYNIELENKDITYENYYTIEEIGNNKYLLNMILDKAFLESEETEYPVLIDPTIGVNENTALQDTYATSTSSADHSSETSFYVANLSNLQAIAYIKFDVSGYKYINPGLINTVTFNAAESRSGTDVSVSLYDCNSIYNMSSVSYSQLSADTGTLQTTCTATTGYTFTITNLFKKWLLNALNETGGKSWQYGFRLKTTTATRLEFIAKEMNIGSPYIAINYNEDTSINDGVYYIKNKLSGKYLEVPDSAKSNGTQCQQNTYKGSKNQQWQVVDIGDGTYTLRPMHANSYALDVYSGTTHGSKVDIWTSSTTSPMTDTQWKLIENSNGSYRLMTMASGKLYSLAVQGASLVDGGKCIQYIYNASQNDQWIFEPAIDAAEYYVTNVNNDKNLSVSSTGNAIASIANTTLDAQRWSIVRQSDGTYKIYNKTGDWLNGADYLGCEITGNAVKLNSGGAKTWNVIINDDGTYSFQNVYNENYITAASNGSGVTVQSYTGSDRQKWDISMALKNICIGGFWEPEDGYSIGTIDYSSLLVTDEVADACETIGCKELVIFDRGTPEAIRDMIRQSSVFSINTHGEYYGILCNPNGQNEVQNILILSVYESPHPDTFITELPEDSFATTRLVFLGACSTAEYVEGKTTNFANVLHEKGAQTVIAFNAPINETALLAFQKGFMISIGEGNSLGDAIGDAEEYMYANTDSPIDSEFLMQRLVIIGNDDMSATFSFE